MKKSNFLLIILAMILILPASTFAQKKSDKKKKRKGEAIERPVLLNNIDTISYIIGSDIARSFKSNEVVVNYDMMNVGIQDGLKGADTLFTPEQIQEIMTAWNQEIMKCKQDKAAKDYMDNKAKGEAFLAENKAKEGVIELPSGLQYKVIREGAGISPVDTSFVRVDYVGTLIDGTVFDSSRERGEPIEFALNGVIPGWTEGLMLMKPGAVYMLYIPADLAYGERKMGTIPAGSTLIFEVELYSIKE
ncbi:MAG: FKBP-type peptidyl-prolyl cis-trans isomerase [Bacteroidales bacterium]|nr:FKBP-type peptidyl-prolyl cis-trans isomerase [Bacteroidales bacterium]